VFRVVADAEGLDQRLERLLIEWQRQMVMKADLQNTRSEYGTSR